jgi:hypothetical protein
VDVAAASKPAVLGSCTTQASNFGFDLEVTPDYAFVTSDVPGSIQAVDIRDPRNPAVRGGFTTAYAPRGLTVVGEYFHIANGPMGYVVSPNPWLAVAPMIDPQPVPLTVPNGGAAVFAPQVRGTLPLACAWTRDGTPLAESVRVRGVASATLALSDCSRADEGAYVLTVSNVKGSATSDAATLTLDANRGFLSSALNTNGMFQLKVPTIAGTSYRVQVSTNLLTWDDFGTVQGTGAAVVLSDPATATAPGTYFRVLKD